MAMEKQSKFALIVVAIVAFLVALWWGYGQWQYHKLDKALHDPDPVVRMGAVRTAWKTGQTDILLQALKDEDPDIRCVAVVSSSYGSNSRMVHALLEVLRDEDRAWIRREAMEGLRNLDPGARPFIYKALEDEDPRIRAGAVLALATPKPMGEQQRPAGEIKIITPLLRKLINDEDEEVRRNAALVLEELNWERGR